MAVGGRFCLLFSVVHQVSLGFAECRHVDGGIEADRPGRDRLAHAGDHEMSDTVQSYSQMLRLSLNGYLIPEAQSFLEMIATDGVVEFPFAPAGVARCLTGREAVAEHLAGIAGKIVFDRIDHAVVHQTTEPDVVFLEFDAVGRGLELGEAYEQKYVCRIRFRDGRIAHMTEYWNPIPVLRVMKGSSRVDALLAGGWDTVAG